MSMLLIPIRSRNCDTTLPPQKKQPKHTEKTPNPSVHSGMGKSTNAIHKTNSFGKQDSVNTELVKMEYNENERAYRKIIASSSQHLKYFLTSTNLKQLAF